MPGRPPCLCTHNPDVRCDDAHCDKVNIGQAFDITKHCRPCFLFFHSEAYNRAYGGDGKVTHAPDVPAPPSPRGRINTTPCIHLGAETGKAPPCILCGAGSTIPLRTCAVHGECTNEKHLVYKENGRTINVPWCRVCKDHRSTPPVTSPGEIRHLAYFVYPHAQSGGAVWRWNIDKLKRRLSLFNGRRVIGIATDDSTEPASAVREALAGCDCEFLEKPNNPALKEVALYTDLLGRVSHYTGPEHALFYGHAKGVTSRGWTAAQGNQRAIQLWAESLYETCLDHWPAVARLLRDYPIAGPFKRNGYRFPEAPDPSRCTWHYSGSFRWHRCADLFARDWRNVQQWWCGGEMQPGELFHTDEAACIAGEFEEVGLALYTDEFWDRKATAMLEDFREKHLPDRRQPLLLTCILASHRKPGFVHQAIRSVLEQSSSDWQLIVIDSGDLHAAGEFVRYTDPRIVITTTGESSANPSTQGWAINECFRRGLVRGDLACYLSDDDVYEKEAFATFLDRARTHPDESAWYGLADRTEIRKDGTEVKLGDLPLPPVAPGTNGGIGGVSLDEKADGGQACHRIATAYAPWPETRDFFVANHCDGLWMDAVGKLATIHALPVKVMRHRHTALSTYTKSSDARP